MNKKWIIAIIALVLIVAVGIYIAMSYEPKQSTTTSVEDDKKGGGTFFGNVIKILGSPGS